MPDSLKPLIFVLALLALPGRGLAFEPVWFDPTAEGCWWVPQSFTAQLLWLGRTRSDEQSLLLTRGELNPITLAIDHEPAVYSSDLTFPAKTGIRSSVLFGKVNGVQAEIAYLGIFDQQNTLRFGETVDEVRMYFFDRVVTNVDTDITQSYESDLHSAEVNLWFDDGCCGCGWPVQGLIGARWFQQGEELEQYETLDLDDRALTELQNDLIGGQLGFRVPLVQAGRWSVIAMAKGGLYSNQVRMSADMQLGGVTIATLEQSDRTTSCSGELTITAVWQWTPWFNLHFGYTGLWLTQVATIGDQFDGFNTTTGAGAFDYDSVSYQGGHFGMTLAW